MGRIINFEEKNKDTIIDIGDGQVLVFPKGMKIRPIEPVDTLKRKPVVFADGTIFLNPEQ